MYFSSILYVINLLNGDNSLNIVMVSSIPGRTYRRKRQELRFIRFFLHSVKSAIVSYSHSYADIVSSINTNTVKKMVLQFSNYDIYTN